MTRDSMKNKEQALELLASDAEYDVQKLVALRKLERMFKQKWNYTPREWLRMMRMRQAAVLLESADSIKQVSYELGFKQPSHFCREFKLHHGVSASEFRKDKDLKARLGKPIKPTDMALGHDAS